MRREEKSDLISALQSSLKEADGVFVIWFLFLKLLKTV